MSQWSGSEYQGPKTHDWEEGMGKFTFPNGVIYEGNFNKGEFHGDGTLIYPNGVSRCSYDWLHVSLPSEVRNPNFSIFNRGVTSLNGIEVSSSKETTSSTIISPSRSKIGRIQPTKTGASTLRSSKVSVPMDSLLSQMTSRDPREFQKELMTSEMATMTL